jgi:hypothetical protein
MAAVMRDVQGVAKADRNQHGGYNYAGHEAVTEALRGAYVAHGILRLATVASHTRENGLLTQVVAVSWVNIDQPEDRVTVHVLGECPATTKNGSATPQQAGIGFSYAVKNAEFKAFSLKGDATEDPEALKVSESSQDPTEELEAILADLGMATTVEELNTVRRDAKALIRRLNPSDRARLVEAGAAAAKRVGS